MNSGARYRWFAVSVFAISSVLNYLDRLILAIVAPLLYTEFHLNNTDYGLLLSAFSIAYAASSPLVGYLLDRAGLNRGIAAIVSFWSAATAATGFAGGFAGLLASRVVLGIAQSGGVPAAGKASAAYLAPKERAIGAAFTQVGLSIGGMLAPWFATTLALRYGWQRPFFVAGLLGFLWVPLWLVTANRIRPRFATPEAVRTPVNAMMRDSRLIALIFANVLWMGSYTLWSNWTNLYLVQVHKLTLDQAKWYAWIPPLAAVGGGFFGGWLSKVWIGCGVAPVPARLRAILVSALGSLATIAVPITPTPAWAIAAISFSYFWVTAGSVNMYTIPLDLYGAQRAGFAIASLGIAYGVLQTVISPLIGYLVDHEGYGPVCWLVAVLPLAGFALLRQVNTD